MTPSRAIGDVCGAALPRGRLVEVPEFGANPGNLTLNVYVPRTLAATAAPLVVVLHGCQQPVASYEQGAGWSRLAERWGFALAFPEQKRENNAQGCFNWFNPGHVQRGQGEVASIRAMTAWMQAAFVLDPGRAFVTGLSAGGAMTAALLATYPEVFAAGAIIAGLPYRCASSVPEALGCMYKGKRRDRRDWGDRVRQASDHAGPWPRVSIWHGTRDTMVRPVNAVELVKQWTDVHGLNPEPDAEERVDGHLRQRWRGADGSVLVEAYEIAGMAHGVPVHPGDEEYQVGIAGSFMLDVGTASSYHIGKFWDLDQPPGQPPPAPRKATPVEPAPKPAEPARATEKAAEVEPMDKPPSRLRRAARSVIKRIKALWLGR